MKNCEKEEMKNGRLKILLKIKFKIRITIIAIVIEPNKKTTHKDETAAAMPIVIAPKYDASSSGERTGFLNRTIDNAPTIPNDRAIFPEITFVITKTIIGSNNNVPV